MFRWICCIAIIAMFTLPASADWIPEDGHKMHWPQEPLLGGMDIGFSGSTLADDWQCSGTGPVDDLHFWISCPEFSDNGPIGPDVAGTSLPVTAEPEIPGFTIQIYSDNPEGPLGFSQPDTLLWERFFIFDELVVLEQPPNLQSWYDPSTQEFIPDNHDTWGLVNITEIPDPFVQQQGEIYWLAITVGQGPAIPGTPVDPDMCTLGWKESGSDHFNDDAVWLDYSGAWMELRDPRSGESLDLAFVVTPEPTAMLLLGCGAVAILRRRG